MNILIILQSKNDYPNHYSMNDKNTGRITNKDNTSCPFHESSQASDKNPGTTQNVLLHHTYSEKTPEISQPDSESVWPSTHHTTVNGPSPQCLFMGTKSNQRRSTKNSFPPLPSLAPQCRLKLIKLIESIVKERRKIGLAKLLNQLVKDERAKLQTEEQVQAQNAKE